MRFGILGPLTVWTADDRVVPVPGAKARALLADLLAHEGEAVSADRLGDDLWGDSPPGNPTGALHTKVWQLRRALEDAEPGAGELVVSRPPGYLLAVRDDDVDARRFAALLAASHGTADLRARAALLGDALALWRGPALADFADAEFARPVVARLEEQRLTALEDRAEVMLGLGEHRLLVGELGDLLARHPLRERLRAAHMRALYGAGRQSEALADFDRLRVALAEQLGLEPSAELVALRQAILERDPHLAPTPTPITTAARPLTNLPAALTPLIGRDAAIGQVRALLDASRLVTLNGIGGVGKTRLALAAAAEVADQHPDGVWLAELATLESEAGVVDLVATVLGVRDEVSGAKPVSLATRLADALRTKQLLLVLDNCEHVVARVADVAELLLMAAPGVRVLATSQEPLGITGERLWTVPPLTLPDDDGPSTAVELFVARATAAAPDFALDGSTADAVRSICRRLDGIPFALELAATRVRALGVHEVAARLENRFALLTQGKRGAPARQQTLRAAIDWSWDLLGEPERVVLRRLSVFSGGCPLHAAEEVCAGGGVAHADVLDLVARLVDRSLVGVADVGGVRRYRLPESVAAYCAERLREAGEADAVRARHAAHHAEFAARALSHLRGPDQRRWLELTDLEAANLRVALDTAAGQGRADLALRIVNRLAWYWFLRGRLGEANRSFALALHVSGQADPSERAKALAWRAGFQLRAGEAGYPLEHYDALADEIAEPVGRATARWFLGFARIGFGDQDSSEKRIDRALAEFRALGDRWGTAAALAALATQAVLRGDLATTRQCGEESAALFQDVGDGWGRLLATDALAQLAEVRGDYEHAVRLHRDGLRIAETLGLWSEVSTKLSGLARIALLDGDHGQARELHERAMRLAAEQSFTFGEQFAEVGLGLGARRQGRLDAAEAHLRRWLDWCRQLDGDAGEALILAELGFVAEQRGDAETALALHQEGYAAAKATGDPRSVALALEGLAGALAIAGRSTEAARLLGAATAAREAVGAPLPPAERGDVERIGAVLRSALGDAYEAHFTRGRALDPVRAHALTER
ncbi:BTAD domain-containing putative transcriptional regulator [Saccharothrix obliqua]|uniref:BTAD domain-containing putative transcriptional regulator n=1 Tax=Saccharothrix obliqua TaxID=2861747 RepID=UPI001C5D9B6E|nr:BTAD domain-containing putative transcriptional regulator [Saccharothrix obliqua]MBW4716739.1 winged helix-turn-helix domain-containing protein [Saccharothrix obliqua]